MSVAESPIRVDFTARSSMDELVESVAEASDPWAGPAETWCRFWDDERWTIADDGPALELARHDAEELEDDEYPALEPDMEPEPFEDLEPRPTVEEPSYEPSEADVAWLAPLGIADDLDDRARTMEALVLADRHDAWMGLHAGY